MVSLPCSLDLQRELHRSHPVNITDKAEALSSLRKVLKRNSIDRKLWDKSMLPWKAILLNFDLKVREQSLSIMSALGITNTVLTWLQTTRSVKQNVTLVWLKNALSKILDNRNMNFDEIKYISFTIAFHSTEQKSTSKQILTKTVNTNLKSVLALKILNGYYLHQSHCNLCNSSTDNPVDSKPHNGYAISIWIQPVSKIKARTAGESSISALMRKSTYCRQIP